MIDPLNAPRVQKAKPKPFQRKSIDIAPAEDIKREWRTVRIDEIVVGDIIANYGQVYGISAPNPRGLIFVDSGADIGVAWHGEVEVFAFVRVKNG